VQVTNVWANRLAGDAKLPRDKRITRIAQKVALGGPLEAGLFGPVQLRVASGDNSTPAMKAGKAWTASSAADSPTRMR
jgi:hypothetical protein